MTRTQKPCAGKGEDRGRTSVRAQQVKKSKIQGEWKKIKKCQEGGGWCDERERGSKVRGERRKNGVVQKP